MKLKVSVLALAVVFAYPSLALAVVIDSSPTPTAQTVSATGMVTQGFNITLSKDVSLAYDINAADATVVTGHLQSTSMFNGSTNGGSVSKCATDTKDKGADVTASTCS